MGVEVWFMHKTENNSFTYFLDLIHPAVLLMALIQPNFDPHLCVSLGFLAARFHLNDVPYEAYII